MASGLESRSIASELMLQSCLDLALQAATEETGPRAEAPQLALRPRRQSQLMTMPSPAATKV